MTQYDRGNEKILHTVEKVVNQSVSATSTAVETVLSNIKPKTEIKIQSALDDVAQAQEALKKGISHQEIIDSIKQSPVAQRLIKAGSDVEKYAYLILKKGQINEAVARNPSKTKTKQKTLEQIQ
ncbi:MAG: hypothetical protein QNJ65_09460 [Xenococcaceae cyanobacterium MO_234.B1]|nr:hypothetical protein [Xenococcaceae cyanobacterium MO_234.B1]